LPLNLTCKYQKKTFTNYRTSDSFIFAFDKIWKLKRILNTFLTFVIITLLIWLFFIIREPLIEKKQYQTRKNEIIKRLELIRQAQFAFKDNYGYFCDNWDSLIHFCKTGNFKIIKSNALSNTLDTILIPVADSIFIKTYPIDSLKFIPLTFEGIFQLEAGTIDQRGVKVHVFQVTDTQPFDPEHILQLGSMSEVNYSGNWK